MVRSLKVLDRNFEAYHIFLVLTAPHLLYALIRKLLTKTKIIIIAIF